MNLDSVDISLLGLEAQIEKIKNSIVDTSVDSNSNLSEIFDAVQSLSELRNAINLERAKTQSLSNHKILEKIISVAFLSFSHVKKNPTCLLSAEGSMHRKMSELLIPIAIFCVKAAVKNYIGMGESYRQSKGFFPNPTLLFSLVSNEDGAFFRLKDDGFSSDTRIKVDFDSENYFLKIRNYMSINGGWLSRKSLGDFGSEISIFIPNQMQKNLAKIFSINSVSFFVPESHILEIGDFKKSLYKDEKIFSINDEHMIYEINREDCVGKKYVSIGVADLHCILIIDHVVSSSCRYISLDAAEWLGESSIYSKFAYSTASEHSKIIPLICGEAIFQIALKKVGQK